MPEHQCQRSNRRADRGPDHQRQEQPGDSGGGTKRGVAGGEAAQEHRRDQDLEQVAEALADRRSEWERGVVVDQQVADHNRRPQLRSQQVQAGDPDAHGEPDDRRDRTGEPERVPEMGRCVVRGDNAGELRKVPAPQANRGLCYAEAPREPLGELCYRVPHRGDAGHSFPGSADR
jgi:hypothetical protein